MKVLPRSGARAARLAGSARLLAPDEALRLEGGFALQAGSFVSVDDAHPMVDALRRALAERFAPGAARPGERPVHVVVVGDDREPPEPSATLLSSDILLALPSARRLADVGADELAVRAMVAFLVKRCALLAGEETDAEAEAERQAYRALDSAKAVPPLDPLVAPEYSAGKLVAAAAMYRRFPEARELPWLLGWLFDRDQDGDRVQAILQRRFGKAESLAPFRERYLQQIGDVIRPSLYVPPAVGAAARRASGAITELFARHPVPQPALEDFARSVLMEGQTLSRTLRSGNARAVRNYKAAVDYVIERSRVPVALTMLDYYRINALLLQRLVTDDDGKDVGGRVRSETIAHSGMQGFILKRYPSPAQAQADLKRFEGWLAYMQHGTNMLVTPAPVIAAEVFRWPVSIHGLPDANGRTCRLTAALYLLLNKLPPPRLLDGENAAALYANRPITSVQGDYAEIYVPAVLRAVEALVERVR